MIEEYSKGNRARVPKRWHNHLDELCHTLAVIEDDILDEDGGKPIRVVVYKRWSPRHGWIYSATRAYSVNGQREIHRKARRP